MRNSYYNVTHKDSASTTDTPEAIDWDNVAPDGDDEDLFNTCPFSPTQPNIKARCVHGHLISGRGEGDDDQGDTCGENGDLTAMQSRNLAPASVCSWQSRTSEDMFRWCCCKDNDCFAKVRTRYTSSTVARMHARIICSQHLTPTRFLHQLSPPL